VLALCDGSRAIALPAARDYSRVGDGDLGPNTGGMGSFSPVPGFGAEEVAELVEAIHEPVLAALAARDSPFVGCLYAGVMLTADGPRVLEFNCRFGDPETQVLLPLIEGDVLAALAAAAGGDLAGVELQTGDGAAVAIALTAPDYPAKGDSGTPIHGVDDAEETGALVFHAGTALRDDVLVTNGGRILNVTGRGRTLEEARVRAYEAAARIDFVGVRYRRDIAGEIHV
jgi:phosphoribosylamine--glycine ligase